MHLRFETRPNKPAVFRFTQELIAAAQARSGLADVRVSLGEDLRDLYVVTAGDYRKPSSRAGRIYRARPDVAGQKTPKVSF